MMAALVVMLSFLFSVLRDPTSLGDCHCKMFDCEYETAARRLHEGLVSDVLTGSSKHQLHCEHRYEFGRQPNVCRDCWTYRDICVCGEVKQPKIHSDVQTVIWTHHKEWGSPSNTGKLIDLSVDNVQLLMKGLNFHMDQLREILKDETLYPVVLWTKNPRKQEQTHPYVSVNDLNEQPLPIVLIVVDGTWRQARRMVNKLDLPRLELQESDLLYATTNLLRKQKSSTKVNTAQATISALFRLNAVSMEDAQSVLNLVEIKTVATIEHQGKTELRLAGYGTNKR